MPDQPKVFISYSHDSAEHKARVRELADRLRGDGVNCTIDQYDQDPAEGWLAWMDRQIEEADFVLVVCTKGYFRRATRREQPGAGRGGVFESALILQEVHDAGMSNEKFLPVLFDDSEREIPRALRAYTSYRIAAAGEGYEDLLRRLTGQRVAKPDIGQVKILPPDRDTIGSRKFLITIARWLRRWWPWSMAAVALGCIWLTWTWWTSHRRAELYQRGLQAMVTLELPLARDYFERVASSGGDLPLERSALAEVLLQLGVADRAVTEAKRAFAARGRLADRDRQLVEARYERIAGSGSEAVRKYRELVSKKPGEVEHALGLADAQMAQGQFEDALKTVAEAQKTSRDLRLGLLEAQAASRLGDSARQLAAASRVVREAKERGLDRLAAKGLLLRAVVYIQRGESQLAMRDLQAAEQRCRDEYRLLAAEAQDGIAVLHFQQGDLRQAEEWFGRALRTYHDLGDREREAGQRTKLATVHAELGKLAQARAEYEKDLDNTDRSQKAVVLANLGGVLHQQGDLPQAVERLREAVGIFKETNERSQAALNLYRLALVHTDALQLDQARRTLADYLALARGRDDEDGHVAADARSVEGKLLFIRGDLDRAWKAHQDARETYEKLGWDRETARTRLDLAEIQLERGLPLEARSLIQAALDYFNSQSFADDDSLARSALARTYLAEGATGTARSLVDQARERAADSEWVELRVQVALVEARVLAAMDRVPEARQVIQRELDDPKTRRCPRLALEARLTQGEIEVVHGDGSRGRELLSRVKEDAGVRGYRLVEANATQLLANPRASRPAA